MPRRALLQRNSDPPAHQGDQQPQQRAVQAWEGRHQLGDDEAGVVVDEGDVGRGLREALHAQRRHGASVAAVSGERLLERREVGRVDGPFVRAGGHEDDARERGRAGAQQREELRREVHPPVDVDRCQLVQALGGHLWKRGASARLLRYASTALVEWMEISA